MLRPLEGFYESSTTYYEMDYLKYAGRDDLKKKEDYVKSYNYISKHLIHNIIRRPKESIFGILNYKDKYYEGEEIEVEIPYLQADLR